MVNIGDMTIQGAAVILPKEFISNFSRDMSLGAGTQSITGVGFKPKSIQFVTAEMSTIGSSCWGFDNLSTQHCMYDNYNISANTYEWNNVRSIRIRKSTFVYDGQIQSFDTDGFTINWTTAGGGPSGTATVIFMAFK